MQRAGPRKRASTPSGGSIDPLHGRRRPDQPLRNLRRGRPRRRARAVRRTRHASAAAGKRGNPGMTTASETYYAARDWDAMAETLADDVLLDDRRRAVGRRGRTGSRSVIENIRAIGRPLGSRRDVDRIATRGERLDSHPCRATRAIKGLRRSDTDVLSIIEINADDRITALVVFDPDDIDAAFAELDARYLAGEAAPTRSTWSVISGAYAALNRRRTPRNDPGLDQHRPPTIGRSA